MCGIVGIISSKEVTGRILNSLKKLEYRGYDSAGITLNNDKKTLETFKLVGKVRDLKNIIPNFCYSILVSFIRSLKIN